jgi:hypothetical protein
MPETLLEKLVGRNLQAQFCPNCQIFLTLSLGEKNKNCPACNKDNLEFASITINCKMDRATTLKEIVDSLP